MKHWATIKSWAPYIILITLAWSTQLWVASFGRGNFESDQAIFGLMSKHVALGHHWPAYVYGELYEGALISIISAPLHALYGLDTIGGVRLTTLLLLLPIFAIHAYISQKYWGKKVALISLLLAIFPSYVIANFTMQPSANFPLRMLFTYGAFLLLIAKPKTENMKTMRTFAMGAVLGLGMWTHASLLLPFAIVGLLWLLSSDEWKSILEKSQTGRSGYLRAMLLRAAVVCTAACFAITVFGQLDHTVRAAASWTWRASGVLAGIIVFAQSTRKKELAFGIGVLIAGYALGNAPQWVGDIFFGIEPNRRLAFVLPTFRHVGLLFRNIIPLFFGVVLPLPDFPAQTRMETIPDVLALMGITALVVYAFVRERKSWTNLLMLKPVATDQLGPLFYGLLIWLHIVALLCTDNELESINSVRQLILPWLPATLMLALGFSAFISRKKFAGITALVVFAAFIGHSNYVIAERNWGAGADLPPAAVLELENYLNTQNIRGVYGDFWTSYGPAYLMDERITFTPFEGKKAYLPYAEFVNDQRRYAIIIRPKRQLYEPVPQTLSELHARMSETMSGTERFPDVRERWLRSTIISKAKVAKWEIWIAEDPQTIDE